MFKTIVTPRMGDVNALRQVNNTVLPVWFETARTEVFEIFNPSFELTYKKWNLLLRHMDLNFFRAIHFGYDVEIRTYITKIGKDSFTLMHEAWQNGQLKANGTAVMIYFDYVKEDAMLINDEERKELTKHYISIEELNKKNKKEMKK